MITSARVIPRGGRPAFTLVELLVVISLFVLLLAIGIPAFASLLRSGERSLASNALATAVRAARDIAQRSEGGDGALVFTMEPGGRVAMVPSIMVGRLQDQDSAGNTVERDVFVPHPLFRASQLPSGWTVRGMASAGLIDPDWYGDDREENAYRVSGSTPTNDEAEWLLPETGFYTGNGIGREKGQSPQDPDRPDNGRKRQTFMLRFANGTGELTASPRGSIAVLPILPIGPNEQTPEDRALRIAGREFLRARDAQDVRVWAERILNDPVFALNARNRALRRQLLGDESVDTALAKALPLVSLANERELVADLSRGRFDNGKQARLELDRETGSLYSADSSENAPKLVGARVRETADAINWLLDGRMVTAQATPSPVIPPAQVFLVSAFRGNTLEVRQ